MYNDSESNCSNEECKKRALETIADEATSVYLCSGDVIERDRVQAALSDGGVPSVYTRHMVSANSQLITGMDFDGFDILVPYELYEKAYDIAVGIGAIKLDNEVIIEDEPPVESEEPQMSRAKRTTVRIISAIILIVIFAGVIYGTDYIVNLIKSLFK
jgi:hypothetical protein